MVHEEQDDGPPATGLAELDRLRELWRHDPARTSLENHFWSRSGYVVPRVVALLDDDGCDDGEGNTDVHADSHAKNMLQN